MVFNTTASNKIATRNSEFYLPYSTSEINNRPILCCIPQKCECLIKFRNGLEDLIWRELRFFMPDNRLFAFNSQKSHFCCYTTLSITCILEFTRQSDEVASVALALTMRAIQLVRTPSPSYWESHGDNSTGNRRRGRRSASVRTCLRNQWIQTFILNAVYK